MRRDWRERNTKRLYWYAKYLVVLFAFVMILSAGLIVYSGGETCYREPTQQELLYNDSFGMLVDVTNNSDDCIIVSDITAVQKEYDLYSLITVLCLIGYLIVQPRDKYKRLVEKFKGE